MNNSNPYSTPEAIDSTTDYSNHEIGKITVRFIFSEDHLKEAFARYRKQFYMSIVFGTVRIIASVVALLVFLFFLAAALSSLVFGGPSFSSGFLYLAAAFIFMFLVVLGWKPHLVSDFMMIRNFKKSPHINSEQLYVFSEEEIYSKGRHSEANSKWEAFHSATLFGDGVLLFVNPKMFHWIPEHSFEEKSGLGRLKRLCSMKLNTKEC